MHFRMKTPLTTFLHVDMDAFFAAVEQRDNPELRGKPVIVGAPPDARGVVSTCSYEARKFGVHSAMPSRQAYKLCPHGIYVSCRAKRYGEVSKQVFAIFEQYTPFVEPLSIDEAFLDITGSMHLRGGDIATAEAIQAQIRDELQLTASIGVAGNKYLAKLASDMNKPDGLTVVPRDPGEITSFLAPLPIRRIWGIGEKSAARLAAKGISHIGQIQAMSQDQLTQMFGERTAEHLYQRAFGIDHRRIVTESTDKSISNEHTFGTDCTDWKTVERTLLGLIEKVGGRLRPSQRTACTVHLKLRWSDFKTITRQQRLDPPTHQDRRLIDAGFELLTREKSGQPVRLVGFGVSGLSGEADDADLIQPDLFGEADGQQAEDERNVELDAAVDAIRQQFGTGGVKRGDW